MKFITDRVRVFAFGIVVAILGLINPSWTVQRVYRALDIGE